MHVDLPAPRVRSKDEVISFDEFTGLLRYLERKPDEMSKFEWLQAIVIICLTGLMGLRIGEVAGVDCEDCDLENWKLHVVRQVLTSRRNAEIRQRSQR